MNLKWLAAIVLIITLFYFFDIRPLIEELHLQQSKQAQLQHAISSYIKKTKTPKPQSIIKLDQVQVTEMLTRALIANGFSMLSLELVKDAHKKSFQIMTFNIIAHGVSYADFENFLSQIELQNYLIVVDHLFIQVFHDEIEIKMKISVLSINRSLNSAFAFKPVGNIRTGKENMLILKNDLGELKMMNEVT